MLYPTMSYGANSTRHVIMSMYTVLYTSAYYIQGTTYRTVPHLTYRHKLRTCSMRRITYPLRHTVHKVEHMCYLAQAICSAPLRSDPIR